VSEFTGVSAVLRVRAPRVARTEPKAYSADRPDLIFQAAGVGSACLAIVIRLGTGLRVSEPA